MLNSKRCIKGFALVAQFTFQPSRTYAQYDLAALVSVPEIDETLASVDKSMYPSVASRELAIITSEYAKENIFYTDRSLIDDVAGFAVQNRNYETGHQLAKPFSVFLAEISELMMGLEHIQICPPGRYMILLDNLSSLMAMRSNKIEIYWDLQQLKYDVKLMWIPSQVEISDRQ
jgi:hypothetical protein